MTKAVQKITLSPSRDIPFNKLVLSQSNVRRIKGGVSIEQLAESIAERTLLQSLNVRAVLDDEGRETGMFEVPAGGRRYRALELLVKQKRMSNCWQRGSRGPSHRGPTMLAWRRCEPRASSSMSGARSIAIRQRAPRPISSPSPSATAIGQCC